jgi:hypothetical protein
MKLIFENWRKHLVEYGLDRDEQAKARDHYYNIKSAIADALTEQGNDWALDESKWEEIIIPSGGSEQDHVRFVQELQAFMQTMQLGDLKDLGVLIEPY